METCIDLTTWLTTPLRDAAMSLYTHVTDAVLLKVLAMNSIQQGPENARKKCCKTCASRPDGVVADVGPKQAADMGEGFWCHQGATEDISATGYEWDVDAERGPAKLDGSPADLCAAWRARFIKTIR